MNESAVLENPRTEPIVIRVKLEAGDVCAYNYRTKEVVFERCDKPLEISFDDLKMKSSYPNEHELQRDVYKMAGELKFNIIWPHSDDGRLRKMIFTRNS